MKNLQRVPFVLHARAAYSISLDCVHSTNIGTAENGLSQRASVPCADSALLPGSHQRQLLQSAAAASAASGARTAAAAAASAAIYMRMP